MLKITLNPTLLDPTNPPDGAPRDPQEAGRPKVDEGLALAERDLEEGRLVEAARRVEAAVRGTAGEAAARDWMRAVRERAVAEQSLELLRAHAAALVHAS